VVRRRCSQLQRSGHRTRVAHISAFVWQHSRARWCGAASRRNYATVAPTITANFPMPTRQEAEAAGADRKGRRGDLVFPCCSGNLCRRRLALWSAAEEKRVRGVRSSSVCSVSDLTPNPSFFHQPDPHLAWEEAERVGFAERLDRAVSLTRDKGIEGRTNRRTGTICEGSTRGSARHVHLGCLSHHNRC
jgi:hypothetical protein